MKKTMYFAILLFAFFAINFSGAFAQDKIKTDSVKTSAVCEMCKKTIEKAVKKLDGIQSCNLDVESKVLTATFNSEELTIEKIRKAVNKAGYDADDQPADPRAYSKLSPCCKKDGHK
jgi:periplasmic mercuric ion binding protein